MSHEEAQGMHTHAALHYKSAIRNSHHLSAYTQISPDLGSYRISKFWCCNKDRKTFYLLGKITIGQTLSVWSTL